MTYNRRLAFLLALRLCAIAYGAPELRVRIRSVFLERLDVCTLTYLQVCVCVCWFRQLGPSQWGWRDIILIFGGQFGAVASAPMPTLKVVGARTGDTDDDDVVRARARAPAVLQPCCTALSDGSGWRWRRRRCCCFYYVCSQWRVRADRPRCTNVLEIQLYIYCGVPPVGGAPPHA